MMRQVFKCFEVFLKSDLDPEKIFSCRILMNMKTLKLNATIKNIPVFMSFILAEAKKTEITLKQLHAIELTSEEILTNIISYAYEEKPDDIEVGVENSGEVMKISFSDNGKEFDITNACDPDINLPLEDRQPGGLGIFLTKQLMDQVYYQRIGDINRVEIVKYLSKEQ